MPLEAAFVSDGSAAQGVLQADDGFVMARIGGVLAVVLQKGLHFGAADVQRTGEIQGNVG
jgi:hypothetical protein